MRVTNQMMINTSLANLNQLRARQAALNEQISSGDRITRPSEDPTASGEVMRVQNRMNLMNQWESTLTNAKQWVRSTEGKLTDLTDLINSAKELAVQGANGTLSPETRKQLAPGATQLLDDVVAALNEREPDGSTFAGFKTDITPFSIDKLTGVVTYSGDSGDMQRDVGPGVTITANIHGNRFVSQYATGWADTNNVLTTLWDLSEGLKAGDQNRVAATLGRLDSARESTIALRAEIGARDMRIQQVESRMKDTRVNLDTVLQETQGVDMMKALMDLTSAETAYRAALQVGARVLPQSLADFLR